MKAVFLTTIFILTFNLLFSQKINYVFRGLSSGTIYSDHLLEFISDTTLEIRTFPRHMSKGFRVTISYRRDRKEIKTLYNDFSHEDSVGLINNDFRLFLNGTTFTKDGSFLVDTNHKILYAPNRKFEKVHFVTYIINGKKYKQEVSSTDGYGLLKNKIKENKELNEMLTSLNNVIANYSVSVYKGLDAYRKFGRKYIYGVIVIKAKE